MEEDDERREAAIASAAPLQSTFKPKTGITSAQLSKFQELHKRRLQLKARSKPKKKTKGLIDGSVNSTAKYTYADGGADVESSSTNEDPGSSLPGNIPHAERDKGGGLRVSKERKKLHWGLDTKERWEMKANM